MDSIVHVIGKLLSFLVLLFRSSEVRRSFRRRSSSEQDYHPGANYLMDDDGWMTYPHKIVESTNFLVISICIECRNYTFKQILTSFIVINAYCYTSINFNFSKNNILNFLTDERRFFMRALYKSHARAHDIGSIAVGLIAGGPASSTSSFGRHRPITICDPEPP